MNKFKKIIIYFIVVLIIFVSGVYIGDKMTYKPSVYTKYYTDNKTGVQYLVVVSKDGGVAIYPRLCLDGTLYSKTKFMFVENERK